MPDPEDLCPLDRCGSTSGDALGGPPLRAELLAKAERVSAGEHPRKAPAEADDLCLIIDAYQLISRCSRPTWAIKQAAPR